MTYVFDACALITFLQQEKGFEKAVEILQNPENTVLMHAVNVGEVYYDEKACALFVLKFMGKEVK